MTVSEVQQLFVDVLHVDGLQRDVERKLETFDEDEMTRICEQGFASLRSGSIDKRLMLGIFALGYCLGKIGGGA